jgi:hypothetical protein
MKGLIDKQTSKKKIIKQKIQINSSKALITITFAEILKTPCFFFIA